MQHFDALITPAQLHQSLDDPALRLVDCRFSLAEPELGRRQYLRGHITGAVYAHLDEHLSSRVIPGQTGRHPLPEIERLARTFSAWGISAGVQVVAYDAQGGALAAARLWWLLNWLGHPRAAVLDGGWQAWTRAGLPQRAGEESYPPAVFEASPQPGLVVSTAEVERLRQDPAYRLLDARAEERYHGRNETIDPVAGHIPGAISAPYAAHLDEQGFFRPPAELRARYDGLLEGVLPERAVVYCGSGVTAAHTSLAFAAAGLPAPRLYAGSWSEWITGSVTRRLLGGGALLR